MCVEILYIEHYSKCFMLIMLFSIYDNTISTNVIHILQTKEVKYKELNKLPS